MNKLVTTAAVIVAMAMAAPSAFAITATQAKAIKKAVSSVPVAEMPAKAAELVKDATKEDREAVAVTAVRAGISKSRTSARLMVSAVIKAAPEVAGAVTMVATEMESEQAGTITSAAISAAPSSSKGEIMSSASHGVYMASGSSSSSHASFSAIPASAPTVTSPFMLAPSRGFTLHGGAAGPVTAPVTQSNTPINTTSGGAGNGSFTGAQANTPSQPPQPVDYTQPRT
jgi:hypothetical protein